MVQDGANPIPPHMLAFSAAGLTRWLPANDSPQLRWQVSVHPRNRCHSQFDGPKERVDLVSVMQSRQASMPAWKAEAPTGAQVNPVFTTAFQHDSARGPAVSGYIRLTNFNVHAASDVQRAIADLQVYPPPPPFLPAWPYRRVCIRQRPGESCEDHQALPVCFGTWSDDYAERPPPPPAAIIPAVPPALPPASPPPLHTASPASVSLPAVEGNGGGGQGGGHGVPFWIRSPNRAGQCCGGH